MSFSSAIYDELIPTPIAPDEVEKVLCVENIGKGCSKNTKEVVDNKVGQHVINVTDGGEINCRWT